MGASKKPNQPATEQTKDTKFNEQMSTLSIAKSDDAIGVVADFENWISKTPDIAVAVAAIQALTRVVSESTATTLMGLQSDIGKAIKTLQSTVTKSSMSLTAGCQLFNRYVTRASLDIPEFEQCKLRLMERGQAFAQRSMQCREAVARMVCRFLKNGSTVLVHGRSRVVIQALQEEAKAGKFFNVVCTESRNDCSGYETARELTAAGIAVRMVLDAGVGYIMEKVDLVLFGAEAVVESGGIINLIGSYQIALVARALKKPVYVAAESYKFIREFPLSQNDLPGGQQICEPVPAGPDFVLPPSAVMHSPSVDYTPPHLITLLFTDIGTLPPSAVSDELIKMWC